MRFKDILKELNIPYITEGHHHCTSGFIQIDCPFCSRDSQKWRMGYSIESHFCNCWVCGSHNVISTLIEITGKQYHQIKRMIDGLDIPKIKRKRLKGKLILPKGIKKLRSAHIKYLRSRGFDWKGLEQLWGIQGIGVASKLQWRIFIPIIYHSQTVSWTTRSILGNRYTTRYISASEKEELIPHHKLLYGEDFARGAVIVTEGVFDVWRIGVGTVCTFSTGYSQEQLEHISKYPIRAICFDSEIEAQKRARRLVDNLSVFPGDTFNVVLDKKDAAEESKENIRRLRKEILE